MLMITDGDPLSAEQRAMLAELEECLDAEGRAILAAMDAGYKRDFKVLEFDFNFRGMLRGGCGPLPWKCIPMDTACPCLHLHYY